MNSETQIGPREGITGRARSCRTTGCTPRSSTGQIRLEGDGTGSYTSITDGEGVPNRWKNSTWNQASRGVEAEPGTGTIVEGNGEAIGVAWATVRRTARGAEPVVAVEAYALSVSAAVGVLGTRRADETGAVGFAVTRLRVADLARATRSIGGAWRIDAFAGPGIADLR